MIWAVVQEMNPGNYKSLRPPGACMYDVGVMTYLPDLGFGGLCTTLKQAGGCFTTCNQSWAVLGERILSGFEGWGNVVKALMKDMK